MDSTYQQQKNREKGPEAEKQQHSSISPASPPSASSSSPSHEFSFTISLHSNPSNSVPDKSKTPPSIAIDLTPADDIFFHGHLLPLHLLSHLPVSPRSSTNSLDSFTLPIKEFLDDPKPEKINTHCSKSDSNIRTRPNISNNSNKNNIHGRFEEKAGRNNKAKSFSLFGFTRRPKETEEKVKPKKKMRFDVSHLLKRYVKMVRRAAPLLFFKKRSNKEDFNDFHRQAYSFSGNLSLIRNKKQDLRGRRGEYSAPASMRTSPTNSGYLVATTTTTGFSSSTSDSSMEELQAAIQAAIAHCKNSIKGEDKLKC